MKSRRAGIATDPKLCRAPWVRFGGDALLYCRRTAGTVGAAAFSCFACHLDGRRRQGPGGFACHRPATPYLSLWARLPGFTVTDLDDALYERRSVVKHLAMRRTLWVIGADDLAQIQAAASDRVAGNERRSWSPMCRRPAWTPTVSDGCDSARAGGAAPSRRARPGERQALAHGAARTGGHIRSGTRKTLGRRHSPCTKGADRAVGARRYRPRARTTGPGRLAARWAADGGLAADRGDACTPEAARADWSDVVAHLRACDGDRYQMVVRQHVDVGAAGAAGYRRGGGGPGRRRRVMRCPDDLEVEADRRSVGALAARP